MTTITKKTTLLPLPVPTWTGTWCSYLESGVPNVGEFGILGTNLDCFAVGDTINVSCDGAEKTVNVTAVTPTKITVMQAEGLTVGKIATYTKTIGGINLTVSDEVIGV